jgi:hypothetical protein
VRFERMALTHLLVGGAVAVAASFLVGPAHAQPGVSYPNPPTQSVSVPSSAYTVPHQASTPLSYATPSVEPAHRFTAPVNVPRIAVALRVVETRAGWSPGYYDYASGQLGRGRPRYGGYWRPAGYHGD